jgi:hypothetical protein
MDLWTSDEGNSLAAHQKLKLSSHREIAPARGATTCSAAEGRAGAR